MGRQIIAFILAGLMLTPLLSGCSKDMLGGAAMGAAGAGAAYEYQNKRQMDKLEEDYNAGNITKDEYLNRKEQIGKGSIIY